MCCARKNQRAWSFVAIWFSPAPRAFSSKSFASTRVRSSACPTPRPPPYRPFCSALCCFLFLSENPQKPRHDPLPNKQGHVKVGCYSERSEESLFIRARIQKNPQVQYSIVCKPRLPSSQTSHAPVAGYRRSG